MKKCKKCGSEVVRLPNQPEMGDGYSGWHRYSCPECGTLTEGQVTE